MFSSESVEDHHLIGCFPYGSSRVERVGVSRPYPRPGD